MAEPATFTTLAEAVASLVHDGDVWSVEPDGSGLVNLSCQRGLR